ncbi:hypothetical protein DMENIID0001_101020 [Sergentomyia squamirostris]
MSVASFSIIIASMTILALASAESSYRSTSVASRVKSHPVSAPRHAGDHTLLDQSHHVVKRAARRHTHVIVTRPVSRGPPRRRRRPPKFTITSYRSKSRPKPPKPVYGPPDYVYGKPIGYVVMNQNNEIVHEGNDYSGLSSHFFDNNIPPNFINDDPPPPYQEEPDLIPSVAYETHSSQNFGPPPSLASEEANHWAQYEEKPKPRRKKPSTTPATPPPTRYSTYSSSQLKPQPPSTSYGVPVSPYSVSSFNPWLNAGSTNSQESVFQKPSDSRLTFSSSSTRHKFNGYPSFPNSFELEQNDEKNLYEAHVSSYDVPLNFVSSSEPKPSLRPTFSKTPNQQSFSHDNFDGGSYENNPSHSYQTYLPPQLPERYNEEDFPGVTRTRQKQKHSQPHPPPPPPADYSGEYSQSDEVLEQPYSFRQPSIPSTRKPVKYFSSKPTTSAQEAFESFVREIRPTLTTTPSPETHLSPISYTFPPTKRPTKPTISYRPRLPVTNSHNLDTDDLRDAYVENSESHEDYNFDSEPISFESMRFAPDSRVSASEKRPQNYVLASAGNQQVHPTTSTENYPKHHPAFLPKSSNIDIISIQKSKSKTYDASTPATRTPPRTHQRHRQYSKTQISRHDDFVPIRTQTTSHKFHPALHFTKTFSSKITQPQHTNHKYQHVVWNGQELPKNHKLTNRDT